MRQLLLVLCLLVACSACATTEGTRALDAGVFLTNIGMGAACLVSGDVVGAALWLGSAGSGVVGEIIRSQ